MIKVEILGNTKHYSYIIGNMEIVSLSKLGLLDAIINYMKIKGIK